MNVYVLHVYNQDTTIGETVIGVFATRELAQQALDGYLACYPSEQYDSSIDEFGLNELPVELR